ncbi:MAG: 30S ribosomal protein S8, partial [Candidatus Bathyarchaeia archaeon]
RINRCGAVRPHYPVKVEKLEEWEKRYLPSRDIGILILTTPKGIISNREAKELRMGGRLLAYVY